MSIKKTVFVFKIKQLNKKNELIEAKVKQQIDTVLPAQLRDQARKTLEACKDIRKFNPFLINKIEEFCKLLQTGLQRLACGFNLMIIDENWQKKLFVTPYVKTISE